MFLCSHKHYQFPVALIYELMPLILGSRITTLFHSAICEKTSQTTNQVVGYMTMFTHETEVSTVRPVRKLRGGRVGGVGPEGSFSGV